MSRRLSTRVAIPKLHQTQGSTSVFSIVRLIDDNHSPFATTRSTLHATLVQFRLHSFPCTHVKQTSLVYLSYSSRAQPYLFSVCLEIFVAIHSLQSRQSRIHTTEEKHDSHDSANQSQFHPYICTLFSALPTIDKGSPCCKAQRT